jgi:hypothetical protein
MRTLPKAASQVLDALTAGLQVGQSRKVDNSGGTYMAVHVDRLSERRYSLAHYYEQNGDLVCDPDGVFLKTDAGWLPVSLQLCTGHYTEAVQVDGDDEPVTFRARALQELVQFGAMWLRNICSQQGGLRAIGQACRHKDGEAADGCTAG